MVVYFSALSFWDLWFNLQPHSWYIELGLTPRVNYLFAEHININFEVQVQRSGTGVIQPCVNDWGINKLLTKFIHLVFLFQARWQHSSCFQPLGSLLSQCVSVSHLWVTCQVHVSQSPNFGQTARSMCLSLPSLGNLPGPCVSVSDLWAVCWVHMWQSPISGQFARSMYPSLPSLGSLPGQCIPVSHLWAVCHVYIYLSQSPISGQSAMSMCVSLPSLVDLTWQCVSVSHLWVICHINVSHSPISVQSAGSTYGSLPSLWSLCSQPGIPKYFSGF